MNTDVENNNYYPTLDENFSKTVELLEQDLPQDKIISLLKCGNIAEKQVAALKISVLENQEQAKILLDNLIEQDGKVREAVSLKLVELVENHIDYFITEHVCDVFLRSVIDVNPNICRNILCIIAKFKLNKTFCRIFIPKLVALTENLTEIVAKIDFKEGKYKINKDVFKLYWCLEALYELAEEIDLEVLKSIVRTTKNINEYTIREKTAKILSKDLHDKELKQIQETLRFDKNYYVRRF